MHCSRSDRLAVHAVRGYELRKLAHSTEHSITWRTASTPLSSCPDTLSQRGGRLRAEPIVAGQKICRAKPHRAMQDNAKNEALQLTEDAYHQTDSGTKPKLATRRLGARRTSGTDMKCASDTWGTSNGTTGAPDETRDACEQLAARRWSVAWARP